MPHTADSDAIDLGELLGALRRRWRWLAGGVLAGVAAAVLATALLPKSYEGEAMIVLRNNAGGSSSMLSRLGGLAGLSDVLPVSLESDLDTELELLTSRAVLGSVVDSLGLQLRMVEPADVSPTEAVSAWTLEGTFAPEEYVLSRSGAAGYAVEGRGVSGTLTPGVPYRLPMGSITLRSGLPDEVTLLIVDREDAISRLADEVEAENTAGQVATIAYRSPDRTTAAAVPNALVEQYLTRRRTTDRGVNQRRYEFLQRHADSIAVELAAAEEGLRRHQEATGMIDPERQGEAEIERSSALRQELGTVEVELGALRDLIAQTTAGSVSARRLAAYPTFLRNPAINDVLSRLLQVETERGLLLERRTEEDPEVVALTENVEHLEGQLRTLAQAYVGGLERQRVALRAELASFRSELSALPNQAKQSLRLQRDVQRLSETLLVLQAQLVQSRLGAIGEGGDVRRVDMATQPRKPAFPKLWLNLALGLFGGLVIGGAGALGGSYLSDRVRDARELERSTGVPVVLLRPESPLLLRGLDDWPSIVLLPVGPSARAGDAAYRIAESAAARGSNVALVDLSSIEAGAALPPASPSAGVAVARGGEGGAGTALTSVGSDVLPVFRPAGDHPAAAVRLALDEMETRFGLTVVALAGLEGRVSEALLTERRVVVLVGKLGEVRRSEVNDALGVLTRAGIPIAGMVLHNGEGDAARRA